MAFQIGGIAIHWYGILVATGFFAGLWTASRRALRQNISSDTVIDLTLWIAAGAILGARTLYVVTHWNEFSGRSIGEIVNFRQGGLVFYGGFIGATLAGALFVRLKKLPFWTYADLLAPSVPLGQVAGRLGCFLNGCCYGHATSLPWAVHYPVPHETAGIGIHPAQIYEAALNLALYFWLERRHPQRRFAGDTFTQYLIAYAIIRFLVELTRGDSPDRWLGGTLTPGQATSLLILAAGVAFRTLQSRKSLPPAPRQP